MPQSYVTFSVLCASVAHESASAIPSTSGRSRGLAPAHRPKAPSTWTQAPRSCAAPMVSVNGSKAPECRFPA